MSNFFVRKFNKQHFQKCFYRSGFTLLLKMQKLCLNYRGHNNKNVELHRKNGLITRAIPLPVVTTV